VCLQATSDSAALQPPSRGDGSSTTSSSSSSSSSSFQSIERSTGDAVYIKSPVGGGVLEYPGRSVVVLGDVPAGETSSSSSRGRCITPAVVCASCIACHSSADVGLVLSSTSAGVLVTG